MQPSGLKFRQTLKNSFFFFFIYHATRTFPLSICLVSPNNVLTLPCKHSGFQNKKGIQILHQASPTMYLHCSCLPARYVRSSHNQREREEAEKVLEHNYRPKLLKHSHPKRCSRPLLHSLETSVHSILFVGTQSLYCETLAVKGLAQLPK